MDWIDLVDPPAFDPDRAAGWPHAHDIINQARFVLALKKRLLMHTGNGTSAKIELGTFRLSTFQFARQPLNPANLLIIYPKTQVYQMLICSFAIIDRFTNSPP